MLNVKILSQPLGPNGSYGTADIALVDGKLVSSVTLSPKACIDAVAKDIAKATGGSPIPGEVAGFIENAAGLG